MTKEEILKLINNHRDSYPQIIKAHNREFYNKISIGYIGEKFGEKLYRWVHENEDFGKCLNCRKSTRFQSFFVGFIKYCSKKCSNIDTAPVRALKLTREILNPLFWIEKECVSCKNKFTSLISRTQSFCSNSCSSDFTANDKNRLRKIKETKLNRYGDSVFVNPEKAKETCIKKYGVDNVSKSIEIKEKIRIIAKRRFFEKLKNHKLNIKCEPMFEFDSYINTDKFNKYKFKCKSCHDIFEDHIDGGHLPRCLKCYPYIQNSSVVELELVEFIKKILPNSDIKRSDRTLISPLELDIYIPSKKIAIEYNGLFWHSELGGKKDKNYHLNKTKLCEEKGIRLIHIFEDDWIDRSQIIKNRLKYILRSECKSVYARKCEVKEITKKESSEFLDLHHLQGSDNSSIQLGLFFQKELISVMTFGRLRLSMGNKIRKDGEYEMYRFCSSKNVVGATSKLLSLFMSLYTPLKIISYSDKCWGNGLVYEKIGFKLVKKTKPNYFYTKDYLKRIYRFNFRKDQLSKKLEIFEPSLSEWENMQLNGYDRIWDCGSLKYEMSFLPKT